MRFLSIISYITVTLLPFVSTADTMGFIKADSAVVLLQGAPGDKDGPGLYSGMNVEIKTEGPFYKKEINFSSQNGEKIIGLVCKVSMTIPDYGSCTLSIPKSKFSTIDPSQHKALLMVSGFDAPALAKLFTQPDELGHIFFSADQRVGVVADVSNGHIESLRIFYSE